MGSSKQKGIPLTTLAESLSNELERPVIDRTGLQQKLDIVLHWTPDTQATSGKADNGTETQWPPLFNAIQEQLNLRLVSSRGSVSMTIIDHIRQPSLD